MASHIGRTFRSGIPPAKPNFDAIGEKRGIEMKFFKSWREREREGLKEKKT
jgi:hypothetical protein